MATYTLFTASYGLNYANIRVRILETLTGTPAIVMTSATGGLLSHQGNAVTDSSGTLAVYLDSAKTFAVYYNQFVLIPSGISLATEVKRTANQLAAVPPASDVALGQGATFYLDSNPAALYRISSDNQSYTLVTGGGGGGSTTFSGLLDAANAPIATTNTSVAQVAATAAGAAAAATAAANAATTAQGAATSAASTAGTALSTATTASNNAATALSTATTAGTNAATALSAATAAQTAVSAKVSLPANWNAATNTPTLISGTNPGNPNSFSNTVAGTTTLTTPIDGITTVNQYDILAYNASTGTFIKIAYATGSSIAGTAFGLVTLDGTSTPVTTAAPTNGQFLIGSTGASAVLGTLTQGGNTGVTITPGPGSLSLATVQDIATTANPVFAGITISGISTLGQMTGSSLNSTPIGSTNPASGAFTGITGTSLNINGSSPIAFNGSPGTLGQVLTSQGSGNAAVWKSLSPSSVSTVAFSTVWDTVGAKDMGDYVVTGATAITSTDIGSIVGGYTQATVVANGTNIPTFDGQTLSTYTNTNGARNRVKLERVGSTKFWSAAPIPGAIIAAAIAPTIGGAPNILVCMLGSPLTFTAATGVTGTPTPSIVYDVMNGASLVQANVTSGSYSPPTAGLSLAVRVTATNTAGSAVLTSTPVTVTSIIDTPDYSTVGDSITQYGNAYFSMTSGTPTFTRDTNGVITIAKTAHGITGCGKANLVNMSDNTFETIGDMVIVDVNTITLQTTVTGAPTTATAITNGALVLQFQFTMRGIWANLQSLAKGGLRFRGNWGQGGDTSAQMTDAISKACAASANFVQLMDGTNDAKSNGATAASVWAARKNNIDQITGAGKIAIVCGITPVGTGITSNGGYAAINALIQTANASAASYCQGSNNKYYVDTFSQAYDTTTNAAYTWATGDGLHPNERNAKLMADAVWAVLSPLIVTHDLLLTSYNGTSVVPYATHLRTMGPWTAAPGYATVTNSGFLAGGSGTRPTAPTSWTAGHSNGGALAVCSVVDPGDGKGQQFQTAFTNVASSDIGSIYPDGSTGPNLTTLGLVAGDRFIVAADVTWTGFTAANAGTITLATSSTFNGSTSIAEVAATSLEGDSGQKYLISGVMTVPSTATGSTGFTPHFDVRFYGLTGSNNATLLVRRASYFKVGALAGGGALGTGPV